MCGTEQSKSAPGAGMNSPELPVDMGSAEGSMERGRLRRTTGQHNQPMMVGATDRYTAGPQQATGRQYQPMVMGRQNRPGETEEESPEMMMGRQEPVMARRQPTKESQDQPIMMGQSLGMREQEMREPTGRGGSPMEKPADSRWGSPVVGILTLLAGIAVFLMAWVPWVRGVTGYSLMVTSGRAGNILWRIEPGRNILLFTGFWALLAGVLLIAGGAAMIFRHRVGGVIALLGGLIGALTGTVTLIMIYRLGNTLSLTTGAGDIVPHAGIWAFTIVAFLAFVSGILGLEGVDNPANDPLARRTMATYGGMRGAHG
jgi:hypothetical protein